MQFEEELVDQVIDIYGTDYDFLAQEIKNLMNNWNKPFWHS